MHSAKQKKIAVFSFAALVVIIIFANALFTTKDIRQSPIQIQANVLQTSQKSLMNKKEESKETRKKKNINVGMILIIAGSVVIIVAGGVSVAQYKKQEFFE